MTPLQREKEPEISVIIPAHNEAAYIEKTLQSVQQQTLKDFETITIANGCTDGTENVIKQFRERAPFPLQLFSLPEANVSRARNYGAQHAKGKLLLFLDADTLLEKDALEKMQKRFTEKYAVATTRVRPDKLTQKYRWAMAIKNAYHQLGLYHGCSGALLCRKRDFEQVGGYDEMIAVKEHRKLILHLKKYGQFVCLPTTVTTSMRRFERWGLWKAIGYWIVQGVKECMGDLQKSKYETIR
ncbi:MAG TPA: glycosyltransferase [Candidatus Nanoarchaeia archaeon]|nr:glycosyltransferase [Candidatus Nanoarchaeia archaeon]